jgi:hypothetical protein
MYGQTPVRVAIGCAETLTQRLQDRLSEHPMLQLGILIRLLMKIASGDNNRSLARRYQATQQSPIDSPPGTTGIQQHQLVAIEPVERHDQFFPADCGAGSKLRGIIMATENE